ncbi:head-tail adaptor protein [Paracoccus sp. MBLB3053]|uniref:Head-tail adaptor protein n=1 Tax=Paracoccus aurantius TaxID=3073814 RepID=A0ABU2HN77_9RHOB|nr:head-tail adaptor protein [Paracoccus sp. MBLB3053]MDS9466020.1 head-tail adaptor protein [Paracoccus sp. MBLB3053]
MRAPRMTVPLVLEAPKSESDGMGGFETVWSPIGEHWAELVAGSSRERAAGIGNENRVSWQIRVRAAAVSDPRRPLPGQRFRMGSGYALRTFLIASVAEDGPEGRYLTCRATEEVRR